ncbi:MAG: NAD(P)(+) transhydrogenase (Re/Si-specific) subunit beta [Myxococcales bacterium]|nr:NAD(P)(+) transhydrogenase (Re/Si-specific) subunit beta [Myxococcales bacterium]
MSPADSSSRSGCSKCSARTTEANVEGVLLTVAYLVAGVLFILSLRGLSSQETARRGNLYGIIGMMVALGAALSSSAVNAYSYVGIAILAGTGVGSVLALRVKMTAMPELVAMLHSFVGAAAALVGFASYFGDPHAAGAARSIHLVETYIAVAIGALTFTGSVIAFLKLRGTLSGKPLLLPGRHGLNLALLVGLVWCAVLFVKAPGVQGVVPLGIATALASVLGIHLVVAIGGADMPVVVSLLNSYSGWTASAAGFMLQNDLLIVTGALVGSSGAILSVIMCRAMNRSIWNVVFSGFGSAPPKKAAAPAASTEALTVNETSVEETAEALLASKAVIIVPGYGLAVARAQHTVCEMTKILRKRDIEVRFAIHPVAGRLPGHMNVLLAEAAVPYDIVLEMDEINDDFPDTDTVMVIGANDIVNPGAQTDESSPIYGMPVLEVWNAKRVVMLKRSRAAGYAGVDNPLFYKRNTEMLFGDAGDSISKLVAILREKA